MKIPKSLIKQFAQGWKELMLEAIRERADEVEGLSDSEEGLEVVETESGATVVAETEKGDIEHMREEFGSTEHPPKRVWEKVFSGKRDRSLRQGNGRVPEGDEPGNG